MPVLFSRLTTTFIKNRLSANPAPHEGTNRNTTSYANAPQTRTLPPEIVGRILDIAVDSDWLEAPFKSRKLCRRAGLVCRSWRFEAQAVLWKRIKICAEATARRLLSSPALGKFRTRQLVLWGRGHGDLTADSASVVMALLMGIETLSLRAFPARYVLLELTILSFPSLRDLTTLYLNDVAFHTVATTFPTFSLHQLEIRGQMLPLPPFPASFLFTSSLRHLCLAVARAEYLQRPFSYCVNVSSLRVSLDHWDWITALRLLKAFPPNQLRKISFRESHRVPVQLLEGMLQCPSVTNLRHLVLPYNNKNDIRDPVGGEGLVQQIKSQWDIRGIKVEFE